MAKGNRSSKLFNSLFQGIYRLFRKGRQAIAHRLQGWAMKINRRSRYNQAGFVLPTVTMVLLVVVLLSLAITFRAFDRAKDARFTRVSEATLQAATPAIDRARAKIAKVLRDLEEDPTGEISDQDIYKNLTLSGAYTFPDEQVLQVSYDINDSGSIEPNGGDTDRGGLLGVEDSEIRDNEQITTAWRFPIDTNNNGAFDSFTLYGIYFRNPEIGSIRTPLDARSLPLPPFTIDDRQECAFISGSNDNLVTDEGWVPMIGKLKKSFFVYTVSVPITPDIKEDQGLGEEYETLQGASGFSPLEYQQEWQQKLFTGVVYKDDLEIAPGPEFNFNGSLLTKSNLIISHFGKGITLYQVSSKDSCFYQEDLSKIQVAGNVINDMVGRSDYQEAAEVHLFQGRDDNPIVTEIETATQSIDGGGTDAKLYLYNDAAYEKRLESLVKCQLDSAAASDPPLVTRIVQRQRGEDPTLTLDKARRDQLTNYFSNRLRKVPIAEVAIDDDEGLDGCGYLQGAAETLAPPDEWADIDQSGINVRADQPEATEPNEQEEAGVELVLGDRLKVGINLPALELNDEEKWVPTTKLLGTWTNGEDRTRATEAEPLPSAGDLTRDGFWEKAAARQPTTALKGIGGLRVITGAGYYDPDRVNSFLETRPKSIDPNTGNVSNTYNDPATAIDEVFEIVWPDTMPMSSPDPTETRKGDLQMRATAVYHYAQDAFNPPADAVQEPIACVSSYYDPSTSITAQNEGGLPWNDDPNGASNNGIVYGKPQTGRPGGAALNGTTGLITITGAVPELADQANYVFPDGRFANEPLRDALISLSEGIAADNLTLSQQAAIDSTLCAIDIANGDLTPDDSFIPHGAIREVAMLNGREVKAIDADDTTTTEVDETFTLSSTLAQPAQLSGNYDLPLEDRQPLEVRLTVIDLDVIRQQEINSNLGIDGLEEEYLLPHSGIIYASRDDALPDRSDRTPDDTGDEIDENQSIAVSPVDFKLDPTRRPNGILLVNGKSLWRNESYDGARVRDVLKEKGLTLVSNLPVYIQAQRDGNKGVFNSHDTLEFGEDEIEWGFNNFYGRQDPVQDFACRGGDPIREELDYPCGGDNWRPATIFADAITLLSDNYRFGYRNEGDFDHRNNAANAIVGYDWDNDGDPLGTQAIAEDQVRLDLNGDGNVTNATIQEDQVTAKIARQLNGFNGYNDFVVNGLSSGITFGIEDDPDNDGEIDSITDDDFDDASYRNNDNNAVDSSYFNNFVTPIQRRGEFPEYVMEICQKLPVSACQPNDWEVIVNGASWKPSAADAATKYNTLVGGGVPKANLDSGTTAEPPEQQYLRYPRRIAFWRKAGNELKLDGSGLPIPIAIERNNPNNVECYYSGGVNAPDTDGCSAFNAGNINQPDNALWFKTNNAGENWGSDHPLFYYDPGDPTTSRFNFTANVQQPLLVPVLQIYTTDNEPGGDVGTLPEGARANAETRWLPRPERDLQFNFVMGAGDVPGRPLETNGGLQNLARVLENWQTPNQRATDILGSFVQTGRSRYATAPYLSAKDDLSLFGGDEIRYNIANAQRRIPYFTPPTRNWGYDVGLLSQPPDYFARKFAQLESEQKCEEDEDGNITSCDKQYTVTQYFREVGKDDPWVKGLLCAKVVDRRGNPDDPDNTSYQEIGNAAPENARGSQCEENGYE